MSDVTVQSVMDKIEELVDVESEQSHTIGMTGGDDFTAEERARYAAAPTLEEIERDLETLSRSMAAYDG